MKRVNFAKMCRHCKREYYPETGDKSKIYCSHACRRAYEREYKEAHFADIFWSKVDKVADGCWLWQGTMSNGGYGFFDINARRYIASRAAYEIVCGPIPDNMCVCHKCDNPRCVRPDHLFLGTKGDNNRDCARKGRVKNYRPALKITSEQMVEIYRLHRQGTSVKKLAKVYGISEQSARSVALGTYRLFPKDAILD